MSKIKYYVKKVKDINYTQFNAYFEWVYQYAKPHLFFILLYTLLGLSGTAISLINSLVSKDLVDIITGHNTGQLLKTFALFIGTTLLSTTVGQISGYISTKISLRIENFIKGDIFDKIMVSDWEIMNKYHSGELSMRYNSDSSMIASGILSFIPNLIIYTFQFCSALYMVMKYDPSFAIFALLGAPVSILISRESFKRMNKNNAENMEVMSKLSAFNQETFSNMQTVKAFDMVSLYSRKLRILQKQYGEVKLHYQKVAIINSIILTIVSMAVTYSAQGWGIYKVWSGAISYGTMTMFLSLSNSLTGTVNTLINLVPVSISLLNSVKRLKNISELPKEDYSQKEEVKEFFEGCKEEGVGICIRDVSYGYVQDNDIFIKACIDAHPYETIAFVGPSGEGKTTMLRYLLSLVKPHEGKGYICAGNSVPEDNRYVELTASARQLMAYVPQGNTMFSGTIAENMRNVKEDATDEEIVEALKLACAWKFVEKLPDGINSKIGERGSGFSEGQAQRLSIARALLRKSPILLLDEATSALDVYTERQVLKNIMADDYPRTCIVTTHRPTVLNICKRVYAIREKQCVQLDKDEIDDLISGF